MPKNSEFRVTMALFALLMVLSLSFGSYYLYKRVGMEAPLEKQLTLLDGVEKVTLESGSQPYDIEITLKKVDNIQSVYQSIQKAVELGIPGKAYKLHLIDQPDPQIQDFYQHMEPAIYESLANNRFIWLDEEIARRTAADQGMKARIFVDSSHLYVQIEDKDAYLYQVIDRNPVQSPALGSEGASGASAG